MKISLTEYIVMIAMLVALAFGVSSAYQHFLVGVNQTTAERITSAGQ